MLVVTIRRHSRSDAGTQGVATLSSSKDRFDTLEPPDRNSQDRRSCIPAGSYVAYLHKVKVLGRGPDGRADFRRVYELHVLGRTHVEIDVGEFAGDVSLGLYNDLMGSIALGFGFEIKLPPNGSLKPQIALQHSEAALARLMKHTHGAGIMVDIFDP